MVHHEFSEEGRKARFEQWEKYGADRLKNDLQTDPYRRVHRRRRRASSRRASRPKSSSQVTLCWRGESAANSSLKFQKFPASWENTGNFADSGLGGAGEAAKKGTKSVSYEPIPYRILTGNFLRPCRELNRAIREVSGMIREIPLSSAIWHSPLVTNPIVPTDLGRCREGEKERCEMLEAIRSRSRARGWPLDSMVHRLTRGQGAQVVFDAVGGRSSSWH